MQLSDRLNAVLNLVVPCDCVADVGCDHGFISIEMINRGIAGRVIAMDVRSGPLSRAQEHIEQSNLQKKIDTRLSDGVDKLKNNEASAVVIAGMGGNLVIHIISAGIGKISKMEQCILQPQSEIEKVRKFLRDNDFKIVAEDMILEDGKYYPMMRAVPHFSEKKVFDSDTVNKSCIKTDEVCCDETTQKLYDCYGEYLLNERNDVLKKFLVRKKEKNVSILSKLKNNMNETELSENDRHLNRIRELYEEKKLIEEALKYWE